MVCEICKKNEGKIHNIYYGNKTADKKGNDRIYGSYTRGERESVVLCDACINHKIAVTVYRRPLILLGLFVISIAMNVVITQFNSSQFSILGCLTTMLFIVSTALLVGFVIAGIQAIAYKTKPEKREKEFMKNNTNEEIAKSLRIKELKQHTSYSVFFTQAEYEKIMRYGREVY